MLERFTGYLVRDEDEHAIPSLTHPLFVGFRHDQPGLNEARKIAADRSGKFGPQVVVDVTSGAEAKVLHRYVDTIEKAVVDGPAQVLRLRPDKPAHIHKTYLCMLRTQIEARTEAGTSWPPSRLSCDIVGN